MIEVTQYLRPHGRREQVSTPDRAPEIEAKAKLIRAAGFQFEAEVLTTGHISLTITSEEADHAMTLCDNPISPEAPKGPNAALDKMVREFDITEQLAVLKELEDDS